MILNTDLTADVMQSFHLCNLFDRLRFIFFFDYPLGHQVLNGFTEVLDIYLFLKTLQPLNQQENFHIRWYLECPKPVQYTLFDKRRHCF